MPWNPQTTDGITDRVIDSDGGVVYYGHVEKVAIARLKNELSSYLDSARRGESILVLDREVPVAKIVSVLMPVFTSSEESDIRVKRLESKGIIRRGDASKIGALLKLPAIKPRRAVNLTAAVLAEREEGR